MSEMHKTSSALQRVSSREPESRAAVRRFLLTLLTKVGELYPWQVPFEHDSYRDRTWGPYETFPDYLRNVDVNGEQKPPGPWSNMTVEDYRDWFAKDTEIVDLLDQAMKGKQGQRNDILYNIQEVRAPTGTSKDATLRRLRKDRPDLHQQVIAGELSANAAALEAGFRRPSVQITDADPATAAVRIREKLGEEFAVALKALL
jgi:hypothetical protein